MKHVAAVLWDTGYQNGAKVSQVHAGTCCDEKVVGHRRQAETWPGKKHMRILASNIRDSDTK